MADQTLAKLVNERSILTLLRASGGSSRAAIARALSLTPATISRLTADMVRRDLLREVTAAAAVSTEREPGRPGIKVAINPEGAYFLGVEIGVSVMRFVLLDLCANVAESVEKPLDHHVSAEEAVSAIDRAFRRFDANPKYRGRIRSAGVTVPGLVTTGGHVVNLPILGWRETDLHGLLSNGIPDLSFSIENNANAAAFGAIYTKPESQEPCTVFLKLGTGCGGAAIVNGRLLRGAAGTAMEPGHINVGDPGAVCNCGQRGCLETWVNLTALARGYLGREPTSNDALANLPSQVADELSRNNPAAIRALDSIAAHLSTGLVSLVNIFNPSQIVLGGAMRPVLQHCLQRLRDEVSARIIPGTLVPDIRLSHLGIFECAIGAACISHHNAFDISNVEIAGPFQPAQSPQSTLVTPPVIPRGASRTA